MESKPPLPDRSTSLLTGFTPVPRRYRHDGWTPARQKAFIEALADTGCIERAARMTNMSSENAYVLRRSPGAEEFRRAWEAALDFGVLRMKDIAFERSIEGQLVPVFVAGKLMGFRRKRNDALLMFCLRHYGQDANGKRTTINYFSSRATASTGSGQATVVAEGAPPPPSAVPPPLGIEGRNGGSGGFDDDGADGDQRLRGRGGDGAARADEAGGGAERVRGRRARCRGAGGDRGGAGGVRGAGAGSRRRPNDQGGPAAADAAADDPGESFFRAEDYRGELLPPTADRGLRAVRGRGAALAPGRGGGCRTGRRDGRRSRRAGGRAEGG